MRKIGITFFIALMLAQAARADFVIEPNPGHAPTTGTPGPFLLTSDLAPSIRYQQVYRGTAFGPVPTQTVRITELAFYPAPWSVHIDVTVPNIQIRLSTSALGTDVLSETFANNIGADQTLVYSGALHFFDTGTETYGIHIALQTPFVYNHNAGNLLMEVRNFALLPPLASGKYALGDVIVLGDSVSCMSASSANALTGFGSTSGMYTRFTVESVVPEPGTPLLLLTGVAACAALRWNRRAARP